MQFWLLFWSYFFNIWINKYVHTKHYKKIIISFRTSWIFRHLFSSDFSCDFLELPLLHVYFHQGGFSHNIAVIFCPTEDCHSLPIFLLTPSAFYARDSFPLLLHGRNFLFIFGLCPFFKDVSKRLLFNLVFFYKLLWATTLFCTSQLNSIDFKCWKNSILRKHFLFLRFSIKFNLKSKQDLLFQFCEIIIILDA